MATILTPEQERRRREAAGQAPEITPRRAGAALRQGAGAVIGGLANLSAKPYREAVDLTSRAIEATAPGRKAAGEFASGFLNLTPSAAPMGSAGLPQRSAAQRPAAGGLSVPNLTANVSGPQRPAAMGAQSAATQAGGKVLGTFNGRTITQADSDRLSGSLNTIAPGAAPALAGGAPAIQSPQVAGAPTAPALSPARQAYNAQVAAANGQNRATNARANRVSASSFMDPRHSNSELLRRFEIAQGSGRQTASERQGRAAMFGNIINGVMSGQQISQKAAEDAIAGENASQARLAEAGVAGQNALAVEGARGNNALAVQGATNQGAIALEQQRALAPPDLTPVTGADGTMQLLNPRTGSLTAAMAGDQPFRPRQAPQAIDPVAKARADLVGTLAPKLLEAAAPAIGQAPDPAATAAALQQATALADQVFGAGQPAAGGPQPSLSEFMAKAKAANPGASEADLRAYYQQNYGGAR